MPHILAAIATLALLAVPLAARAEEQQGVTPPQELAFLVAGKDYLIRFPEGHNIFQTKRSELEANPDPGRRPGVWTINYSVQVFHVVRFGGGSWVLVRHPAKLEDSFKWFGHRRALAILQSDRAEQIKEEPDGGEKLARLSEAAEREIDTAETWINLDHAVAIADVPTEAIDAKLSVQSIETSRR